MDFEDGNVSLWSKRIFTRVVALSFAGLPVHARERELNLLWAEEITLLIINRQIKYIYMFIIIIFIYIVYYEVF